LCHQETNDGQGHYHVCCHPDRLIDQVKFCTQCLRFVTRQSFKHHNCTIAPFICYHCYKRFETEGQLQVHKSQGPISVCGDCYTEAYSEACAQRHQCDGRNRRCDNCSQIYDTHTEHICFTTLCQICGEMVGSNHRCYWQTAQLPNRREPDLYVYDFESDTTGEYHRVISVSWIKVGATVDNCHYICGWDSRR
jgi:hypothetical protein